MGILLALTVAGFVAAAWVAGAFYGAEASRARHYQDCMRKLGYDPVMTTVGGFSGPIEPGQRFVLYPACPERRVVLYFDRVSDCTRFDGGDATLIFRDEKGVSWVGGEEFFRDHAARMEG